MVILNHQRTRKRCRKPKRKGNVVSKKYEVEVKRDPKASPAVHPMQLGRFSAPISSSWREKDARKTLKRREDVIKESQE